MPRTLVPSGRWSSLPADGFSWFGDSPFYKLIEDDSSLPDFPDTDCHLHGLSVFCPAAFPFNYLCHCWPVQSLGLGQIYSQQTVHGHASILYKSLMLSWPVWFLAIFMDSHKKNPENLGSSFETLGMLFRCSLSVVSYKKRNNRSWTLYLCNLVDQIIKRYLIKMSCINGLVSLYVCWFIQSVFHLWDTRHPQSGTWICDSVWRVLRIFQKYYKMPLGNFFCIF